MIPKLQLRQRSLIAFLFAVIIFVNNSCKKTDTLVIDTKKEIIKETPENFFNLPANASPVLKRIAKELQRQNYAKEFINAFIAKEGFPVWGKSRIERHKRKTNTVSFEGDGLEDTTVYIPLIVSVDEYVTGFLKATVADTIDIKIFRQNDYINFPFKTPTASNNVTTAEEYATRFMQMDKDVFGTTEFFIKDKRMFNNSTDYSDTANIQRFMSLNAGGGSEGFADGTTINNYQYEICYTANTYRWECTGNNCCAWVEYGSYTHCTTYESGGGTGGGGGGSGGGGGGGGTWPFPPSGSGGGGAPCVEFGESITNSFIPIEYSPSGGNPWPPQTPQSWLDNIWLTYNVKDSTNNPCVASVLTTLRTISFKLPEILRSVFDTSGTNGFDVTFKIQNLGTYAGRSTVRNISNFDYKSKINNFFSDATDLSVASTIIHEVFHCQLMAWYRKSFLLNDTVLRNNLVRKYGYLFTNQYINLDSNFIAIATGPDVLQHQDIAVRYRNIIGEALYQFAVKKNINVTLEYCKDLAWSGCQDSRAFLGLSSNSQATIDERIKAEKDPYGNTINDPFYSPKGHPCL